MSLKLTLDLSVNSSTQFAASPSTADHSNNNSVADEQFTPIDGVGVSNKQER